MTPTVTKELIIRLENNQIPVHEKSPPLSLSVKRRRWEFTFFFPVSNLVEHHLFSSLSRRGNDGTLFNGSSQSQSANYKTTRLSFTSGATISSDSKWPHAGGQGLLSAPSTVNESHWTSKGAINKQTLAHPLIANDRLFVLCFPSGSKCSNVTTQSTSGWVADRERSHWYINH